MANALLTPDMITREALRILHQKLNFIGSINRQYDSSFAKSGAKIGDSLRIRLPNEYKVRSGAALSTGADLDTLETSTTLRVSTQKGVDTEFSSTELTLSLDDFSKRILEPAMAVLAATMESDALSMINDVYNHVDNKGNALTLKVLLQGRKVLNDNLAPMDDNRTAILNTQDNVDLVSALSGLFQDSTAIKKQYKEGMMGRTSGFDFFENTLMPAHTSGSVATPASAYTVSGAVTTNGSTEVTVTSAGSTTWKVGDIFTVADTFRVHPETKVSTAVLQSFVVTADTSGSGQLKFSPAIYTTGGKQNVTAGGFVNGKALVKIGSANGVYKPSIVFHKDAFTFATADLVQPKGVDFASRQNYDGLSMRIVRAYDISSDKFPCRIDVLYGYKAIRPQLACQLLSN